MRTLTLTAALFATAAAHAATPVKPCDLLSQSAAASLWGGTIESVRPLGDAGCSYERPHDEFIMTQILNASNWGANAPMIFKMLLGGTPTGGTGEPIPRIRRDGHLHHSISGTGWESRGLHGVCLRAWARSQNNRPPLH